MKTRTFLTLLAAAALVATLARAETAESDPYRVSMQASIGPCGGLGSDCAEDVPMTGTAYPGFGELDIAMRQFLKFRCGGAGVLAVSLDGRRVYKRGFGRVFGLAYDDNPNCTPPPGPIASAPVAPDTPLPIGSVSKLITASRVRELVWAHVVERGRDDVYADASEVLLLDSALQLLPPELMEAFGSSNCGGIVVDDIPGCTRACSLFGPDIRWHDVTIGDLIAHTAGLPGSAPSWPDVVVPNYAWLRGYTTRDDWAADEAAVQAQHPEFFLQMEDLRDTLAAGLGLEEDQELFFLSRYDPASANPVDEWMKVIAGRCLQSNPGGSTDTLGTQGAWAYSNTGYAILDRVVSHLSASGRYGAETGFPEQHAGSEMDVFLREVLGIDGGVATREGWFHWQRAFGIPDYEDPVPEGRGWDGVTAYPLAADLKRPYCIWDPDEGDCDLDTWRFAADKPRWDFSDATPVPFARTEQALNIGQGAVATEAPVLLRMINAYAVGNDNVHQGRPRATCGAACGGVQLKNGGLPGGAAWAGSLAGGKPKVTLPALDAYGRITADFAKTVEVSVTEKPGVDFVVAVNQSEDENCDDGACNGYGMLQAIVRYGLSRTDWQAVEHHLATEPLQWGARQSRQRHLVVYPPRRQGAGRHRRHGHGREQPGLYLVPRRRLQRRHVGRSRRLRLLQHLRAAAGRDRRGRRRHRQRLRRSLLRALRRRRGERRQGARPRLLQPAPSSLRGHDDDRRGHDGRLVPDRTRPGLAGHAARQRGLAHRAQPRLGAAAGGQALRRRPRHRRHGVRRRDDLVRRRRSRHRLRRSLVHRFSRPRDPAEAGDLGRSPRRRRLAGRRHV